MNHAREDYNHIQDPSGKIPIDEPVCLIRGQDALAPALFRRYIELLEDSGAKQDIIDSVETHIERVVEWQTKKGKKIPDL